MSNLSYLLNWQTQSTEHTLCARLYVPVLAMTYCQMIMIQWRYGPFATPFAALKYFCIQFCRTKSFILLVSNKLFYLALRMSANETLSLLFIHIFADQTVSRAKDKILKKYFALFRFAVKSRLSLNRRSIQRSYFVLFLWIFLFATNNLWIRCSFQISIHLSKVLLSITSFAEYQMFIHNSCIEYCFEH